MVKSLSAFCAESEVLRRIYFAAKQIYFAAKDWVIGPAFRGLHALTRLRAFEPDEAVLARAESILMRAIALGKEGRFKVVPEFILVSATENCNLECVMCPGHAGMSGPKLSVGEAEMLFVSLADKDINYGRPKVLDMTSGEPTLNPNLGTIHGRFKELFPNAKISIISNATLAVRGSVRKAFEHADVIGLSMDGATAETFERIRKGSVYKNVLRNIRDIAEMKKEGVNCVNLHLMFVAMDQNIHELPEMVRLAHSLRIPRLFAQASEVRTTPFNAEGQNVSLSLPKEDLRPFVSEAIAEAKRLGIVLSLTSRLQEALEPSQPIRPTPASEQSAEPPAWLQEALEPSQLIHPTPASEQSAEPPANLAAAIKTCSVPWMNSPRISQNRIGIYPTTVCCHMPHVYRSGNLENREEFRGKSINDIFNSEFYWNIRSALLDGTLAKDACEGCQYHQMTQWTGSQLRKLEAAIEAVEPFAEK